MNKNKKIPHDNVCAEDIFKYMVNVEDNTLFAKPTVPFSLVYTLGKLIEEITKIVYWDDENLICSECWHKLHMNSHSKR
ncbi:MAG: hypothetical protein LBT66_02695 [Methanobrevibacter sp.]|jgi:hypothetical protein|nr:hypothetical protein [Candidatus Methanovirga meridionalis]